MTDARPRTQYHFDLVAARLGEAGMTLLAMQIAGVRPSGYRSFWPDMSGAEADGLNDAAPTARQISEMDEALGWIGLIPENQVTLRKLVGARALSRVRLRRREGKLVEVLVPIFSWQVLGDRMGCSEFTSKSWWIRGIEMIVEQLNRPGLCETAPFRGSRQMSEAAVRQASARLTKAMRQAVTS